MPPASRRPASSHLAGTAGPPGACIDGFGEHQGGNSRRCSSFKTASIPGVVLQFPEAARGLNGGCLIAPAVLLIADCFASLIWRVDVPADEGKPAAGIWLKHDSMASDPDGPAPGQPGINGVEYSSKTDCLYYTTTAQELFLRVAVDPDTHDPAGEPEFVAGGMMGDDFCIDDDAGVAYIATHRQNTIDRVSLNPSENSYRRHSVAGKPLTKQLIGPTIGRWGRGSGEPRRQQISPGPRAYCE